MKSYLVRFLTSVLFVFLCFQPVNAQRKESKEEKREKELQNIEQEIQGEVDQVPIQSLSNLYRDDFLQDYINEVRQSLVPKETPPEISVRAENIMAFRGTEKRYRNPVG